MLLLRVEFKCFFSHHIAVSHHTDPNPPRALRPVADGYLSERRWVVQPKRTDNTEPPETTRCKERPTAH